MTTALTPEPRSGQQPASRDSEVAMLPTREPRLNRDEMLAAARDLIEHGYQLTLLYGTGPELSLLWPTLAGTAVALILGWWYFDATEGRFADVL